MWWIRLIPVITLNGDAILPTRRAVSTSMRMRVGRIIVDGSGVVIGRAKWISRHPGGYVLSFNYTDSGGNEAVTVIRTVNVVDTTVPVITLNGDSNITHEAGSTYHDANATWSDIVDGSGVVIGTGDVNEDIPGIYSLSYNVTDSNGNSAHTVIREVTVYNTNPQGLKSLEGLDVHENEPIGIVVGNFGAIDANGNALSFYLIDGEGNESNSLFEMEENGTLKTAVIFDYEANASRHSIRVRASDEYNGSVDGNFTVNLLDRNEQPYDLQASASLMVEENLPAGSFVGDFVAKDPDEDILSYILVGDQNLTFPFELSKSGELVTTEVLDFERQEKYSLTVRALDANGSFQERVFDVDIIDCFIPVVNTLLPYFDENGTLQVGGEISDDGGNSQNLEVGILVSESPIGGLLGNEGVMELEIFESQNLYRFEKGMIPKKGWEKIYVRAYAKNAEGVAYGLEESILKDLPEDLSHWADARPVNGASGWWESPWFGTFYKSKSGWMLHVELGWIYPSPGEGGSLWLWKENLDWVWTDEKLYPFLFSAKQSNWMYFYGALNQQRLLYHYGDQEWVDLDDSKVSEKEDAR